MANLPPWYVTMPMLIVKDPSLSDQESRALAVLWAATVSNPEWTFTRSEAAHLLQRTLGVSRTRAYDRLAALVGKDLVVEDDEATASEPGRRLRLGGRLEPYLKALRRGRLGARSPIFGNPENGTPPPYPPLGGGGIPISKRDYINTLDHDPPRELVKPPPPQGEGGAGGRGSPENGTGRPESGTNRPENGTGRPESGTNRPENGTGVGALEAIARQIGIVRRSGVLALLESGLGPRAAWRLWRQVEAGGGGVGAFVSLLVEWGPAVVGRVPPADGRHPPRDPCPLCASSVYPTGEPGRGKCSRGHTLRLCPCGEWAPEGEICPWCGAPDEPETPEPEVLPSPPATAEPDPSIQTPVGAFRTAEQVWQATLGELQLETTRATFNTHLRRSRLVSYDDGVFTVAVINDYTKDWLENRLASTIRRILTRLAKRTVEVRFVTEAEWAEKSNVNAEVA